MDDHLQMIEDCEKRESRLSDWETGFIDNISNQIAERPLTAKQTEILEHVWERVTARG